MGHALFGMGRYLLFFLVVLFPEFVKGLCWFIERVRERFVAQYWTLFPWRSVRGFGEASTSPQSSSELSARMTVSCIIPVS